MAKKLEFVPTAMNDALGGTVITGDWVAYASGINGALSIGQVERFNEKSMIVKPRRGKPIRKISTQIIKITDEQVMLHMFIK